MRQARKVSLEDGMGWEGEGREMKRDMRVCVFVRDKDDQVQ